MFLRALVLSGRRLGYCCAILVLFALNVTGAEAAPSSGVQVSLTYVVYEARHSGPPPPPTPLSAGQAKVTVRDASGHVVGSGRTDARGRCRIALPPGTYTVQAVYAARDASTKVQVKSGSFTAATLVFKMYPPSHPPHRLPPH